MSEQIADEAYHSPNLHKYQSGNSFYQKHLTAFMDCVADFVVSADPAPQTVLDAGCGEGFVVDHLSRRHPDLKITGVDLDEGAVAYAKEHFGEQARFRKGSVYKLPFSDRSFDLVLCSEVLEHLDDPNRAINEIKRVARHHVLITVPREPYFQWLNNVGQWLGLSPDPGHVNFWTQSSFAAFIRGHFKDPDLATKHIYQLARAKVS